MLPIPARWLSTPVMSMVRVGEQAAPTWKLVKRMPSAASLSMFGVSISLPKLPMSPKPMSSASRMRMFGRFAAGGADAGSAAACGAGADSRSEHAAIKVEERAISSVVIQKSALDISCSTSCTLG